MGVVDAAQGLLNWISAWWTLNASQPLALDPSPFRAPKGMLSRVTQRLGVWSDDVNRTFYSRFIWTTTNYDFRRARIYWNPQTILATNAPIAIGALYVRTTGSTFINDPKGLTHADIGGTQISSTFQHPAYAVTVTTTAGQRYLTTIAGISRLAGCFVQPGTSVVRIESGADKGVYLVQSYDYSNNRLYLMHMDGTMFIAQATATLVNAYIAQRPTFFNEVGVIPNGTGTVLIDGTYDATDARRSWIARIIFEKTGGCALDYTQGSYWFSLRQFVCGTGVLGDDNNEDIGAVDNQSLRYGTEVLTQGSAPYYQSKCVGLAIDSNNERIWAVTNDGTSVGNVMWKFQRSLDCFHEVVNTVNTMGDDTISGINIAGGLPFGMQLGKDGTAWGCVYGGVNAGVYRINPDLATVDQGRYTDWSTTANVAGLAVDTSRNRVGTAGDVVTTAAGNTITSASAAFTGADVGRVIKIAGATNDNGTYRISSVTDTTHVVVTTLAGAAVAFTGGTGGTFSIGDRIYVFFNDTTSSPGKVRYLESLAPATNLFSTTVTMTNGANINRNSPTYQSPAAVDQSNGVLYWGSSDTAQQVNRYDPTTQTWSRRLLSDFNGLNGGTGTATNPTTIQGIGVNPHASFREVWITTDQGHIKLDATNFAGSYSRYYGANATYTVSGQPQNDGCSFAGVRSFIGFAFNVDGRVYAMTFNGEIVQYNREADTWVAGCTQSITYYSWLGVPQFTLDNTGSGFLFAPQGNSNEGSTVAMEWTAPIHYQWIGAQWVPKEVVRGLLPDSVSSPGCVAKPLHTSKEELVYGVTASFTPQGGATPANNEFLGRFGQTAAQRTDGATTVGTNSFQGTSFSASDTGRRLRIESGADQGVYIATFVDSSHVTLAKLNGVAFSASATASTLSYTLWEQQTNPGPETATAALIDGVANDNTTAVSGLALDIFAARTIKNDQTEDIKHAVNVEDIGVVDGGSTGANVYYTNYAKSLNPNYNPAIPGHVALPASPTAGATQMLRGTDAWMDGTGGRLLQRVDANWYGMASFATTGVFVDVDFGADVEVGSIRIATANMAASPYGGAPFYNADGGNYGGLLGHVYNLSGNTPPADASVVRTSGVANINYVSGTRTLTLSSGDFLGTQVKSGTAGTTTASTSTFGEAAGTFLASHVGMALKITSGGAAGTYRITAVAGDGSSCTIQNLDMTSYTFAATASGLSWSIWDAVQNNDMILVVNNGNQKLCVERLLSTTSAEIRTTASNATNSNWTCYKPSWNLVKRLSNAPGMAPPDVYDNGTFGALGFHTDNGQGEIWFDLNDLPTSERKARYWRFSAMPHDHNSANAVTNNSAGFNIITFFDLAGTPLGTFDYNRVSGTSNADFFASFISRIDWIQATDTDAGAGFNGTADVASDGTVTLTNAANLFMGRHVRGGASGAMTSGGNTITVTAPEGFVSSDMGRFIRITAGANAGVYRISGVNSATIVTVTTPNGTAVTWGATLSAQAFEINEGIATNDYMAFPDPVNDASVTDHQILSVSDDLKTITIDQWTGTLTGKKFEVRRRGINDSRDVSDASLNARVLYSAAATPLQPGDISQDCEGTIEYWPDDVRSRPVRTDGATTAAGSTFGAAAAAPTADDVGRLLVVQSGADKGIYKITAVAGTNLTLGKLAGGAATLTATATGLSYQIIGDRRIRISHYVTVLSE